MARPLRPRPPLAIAPLFVSQDTAHALLGITARKFLEQVVPRCHGHVVRLGKTVLLPVAVVVERLQELTAGDAANEDASALADDADADADDAPADVDAVLARLGLERAPSHQQ